MVRNCTVAFVTLILVCCVESAVIHDTETQGEFSTGNSGIWGEWLRENLLPSQSPEKAQRTESKHLRTKQTSLNNIKSAVYDIESQRTRPGDNGYTAHEFVLSDENSSNLSLGSNGNNYVEKMNANSENVTQTSLSSATANMKNFSASSIDINTNFTHGTGEIMQSSTSVERINKNHIKSTTPFYQQEKNTEQFIGTIRPFEQIPFETTQLETMSFTDHRSSPSYKTSSTISDVEEAAGQTTLGYNGSSNDEHTAFESLGDSTITEQTTVRNDAKNNQSFQAALGLQTAVSRIDHLALTHNTDNRTTQTTPPNDATKETTVEREPKIVYNGTNLDHEMQLDFEGNYKLHWSLSDTSITFEVRVSTRGWVGFGISPNGGMYPADVVVGWVTDGHAYFADYHTDRNSRPVRDESQDWELLHGEERGGGTVLRFTRLLDTCDDENDIAIQNDTTVVIFAYHDEDPSDEHGILYHGKLRRGSKEILLSNPGQERPLSPDVKSFDFIYSNITLPPQDTYYHCEIIKFPELDQPHHVIGYEAVFSPGNKRFVHHSILYECQGLDDSFIGYSFACLDEIIFVRFCSGHYFVSALNSLPVFFPDHVGLSVGGASDPKFFLLQTHFSNPEGIKGVVDQSGFRAFYTPILRANTAQMMIAGTFPERNLFFIPPHFNTFHATGYCMPDCFEKGMGNDTEEIRLVWIGHHTHVIGRGIVTRHIRDGVELRPIAAHPNFNFNFQVHKRLDPEPVIKKTDMIRVDCTYDSTGRTTISNGGFGTREEMCMSFIMYYPKISLGQCYSGPLYSDISSTSWGVRKHFQSWDFTNTNRRLEFQKLTDESDHRYYCGGSDIDETWASVRKPEISVPYKKPPSDCKT
ncbi:hypothetical protein ScPMuIL_010635 [Solemya velum]